MKSRVSGFFLDFWRFILFHLNSWVFTPFQQPSLGRSWEIWEEECWLKCDTMCFVWPNSALDFNYRICSPWCLCIFPS